MEMAVLDRPALSPDRMRSTSPDLTRLRGTPTVFVVDRMLKLTAICGGGAAGTDEALTEKWAGEIEPVVRELVRHASPGADASFVGTFSEDEIVRVFSLRGELGGYAAFLERRRTRKSIRTTCVQYGLSQREFDVLELVVAGKNSADIARQLHITDATVQSHVRNVGIKMGCTKRSAMIAKALIG